MKSGSKIKNRVSILAIASVGLFSCSASPDPISANPGSPDPPVTVVQTAAAPPTDSPVTTAPATATPDPSLNAPPSAPEVAQVSVPVITPDTENCPIRMAVVDDPDGPLNVRSSPEVTTDNVVSSLENQAFVSIVQEQGTWFEIETPIQGWIAKSRTRYTCARVDKAIALDASNPQARVQGSLIGTGIHQYRVSLSGGETLTVENQNGIFPSVLSPDQQLLNPDWSGTEEITTWSQTLTTPGDYSLFLDSNFRGFDYDFQIRVD